MRLRIVSDIHTEFTPDVEFESFIDKCVLPRMAGDADTVLVLAGDIGTVSKKEKVKKLVAHLSRRFKDVLIIPGNHDYYGGDFLTSAFEMANALKEYKNVFYTEFGGCIIDGRKIWMTTLWTDFGAGGIEAARDCMPDYRWIKFGDRKLAPEDTAAFHKIAVDWLGAVGRGDIVITHHLPSYKSVASKYAGSDLNGAFASDLDDLIKERGASLWVHGHTHDNMDYLIGDTRIVCNPYGYPGENQKYKPEFVIDI